MASIELGVSAVPYRKGKWLWVSEGSAFRLLAKFRNDEAVTEFFRWVEANEGKALQRGVDEADRQEW